jgi:hypothetical protein
MDEPEDNGDDCPSLALSNNGITAAEEGPPTVVVVEVGLLLPLRILDSVGLPSSTKLSAVLVVVCILVPKWGKGDLLIRLSVPVCVVDHGDMGLFQVGSIDRGSIWDAFDELGRSASDVD